MTTKKIKEEFVDIRDASSSCKGLSSKSALPAHHYGEFLVLNLERKNSKSMKDVKDSLLSSDYREYNKMPDSPESSKGQLTVNTNTGSASGLNHSLKGPSALSGGMNGSHSPHSTMNGGSPPSPTTSLGSSVPTTTSNTEMSSGCNVRQLSKLKRFLTTLQQFGSDISPEIGERVRTLILNLVNGTLTIEDFHHKLQETTNFPLRPFVVPFLRTNLPLLQRELIQGARLAKQSPQQYLRQHEHLVLDPSHSPTEASDIFHSEINENGKRRTPDSLSQHSARVKENGSVESSLDMAPPPKRHHSLMSPPIPNRTSPGGISLHAAAPLRLEDVSLCRDLRERDRERYEFRHYGVPLRDMLDEREMEDEWKNIHTMLNCILGMVEKTKRALAILQHRSLTDRHEMALWIRRHSEGSEHDMKKRAGEMMAHTLKTTEDRVSEVKRRAEEAVNEVKRQAVVELQKAVSAAEAKASELVAAERAKMEKLIMEARRQATEEALTNLNRQEESSESCWNCGRKANETCSGCNVARYCGAFCQHKDWENHHHVCGQAQANNLTASTSATTVTAQTATESRSNSGSPAVTVGAKTPSPPATSRSGSRSATPVETKPQIDSKH